MRRAVQACIVANVLVVDHAAAQVANPPINVTSPGIMGATPAVPDASWGLTNCTVIGGNTTVTCPAPASLTSTGPSSVLVADDAGSTSGAAGARIPFVGTISAVTIGASGVLSLTLSTAPTFSNAGTIPNHVASLAVISGGTGYTFSSTQTMVCSSCTVGVNGYIPATARAAVMQAAAGTQSVSNRGTGGTPGQCTLTLPSQTAIGKNFTQFVGTILAGGSTLSPTVITTAAGSITTTSLLQFRVGSIPITPPSPIVAL